MYGFISTSKLHSKKLLLSQVYPGVTNKNQKSNKQVHNIKILLNSGISASIIRKNIFTNNAKFLSSEKEQEKNK